MNELKSLRNKKKLTQKQTADLCRMSLRSYKMYENDETKVGSIKYDYIKEKLNKVGFIDEEHGILTLDEIKTIVTDVMKNYDIDYCILFGSYSRGEANDKSDIDLLMSSKITGLDYFGLVEDLRVNLRKVVDLLNTNQLKNNIKLTENILQDGIKIYKKENIKEKNKIKKNIKKKTKNIKKEK